MTSDLPALSSNFIRMISASLAIWTVAAIQGQVRSTLRALESQPKALQFSALGAVAGPFLGVSLSLLAIQYAPLGVASTLMALPPVLLLPFSYFIDRERFGWQAIAGTLLALSGITLLFIV
jgi:drug/metabolite transporter (DMT)-like permease